MITPLWWTGISLCVVILCTGAVWVAATYPAWAFVAACLVAAFIGWLKPWVDDYGQIED